MSDIGEQNGHQVTWIDFAANAALDGVTSPGVSPYRYCVVGKLVFVYADFTGTSNQTYKQFALPLPVAAVAQGQIGGNGFGKDAGVFQSTPPVFIVGFDQKGGGIFSPTLCSIFKNFSANNWTASGAWSASGQFFYETT